MIYFDNAATSWPKPEMVYQAVDQCLRSVSGNPGRGFSKGSRNAVSILYETREELADLFGISNPSQVAFTHNATDALNIALFGTINPGDCVITTSMEHNAVARPLKYLESIGVKVVKIAADEEGHINLECLERAAAKGVNAIVLSHASNVTGTITPLAEIGAIAQKHQVLLIVDAAQTAGIEAIDVAKMNIGLLAFSGHKSLFGPQGTGGLYIREKLAVKPIRYGGTGSLSESEQQPDFLPDSLESGTLNTPGIAGLLAGLRFIKKIGRDTIKQKEIELAAHLVEGLKKISRVKVYGPANYRDRTAVVSFTIANLDSSQVAYELDQDFGIACRGGLHCAPWAHKTIGTIGSGTIRFSPGFFNHEDEIAAALKAVQIIAERNEKHEGNSG
ncbi:aminotransferase class V-fold PLP-dependent enzyme [bacterium BFN5]|nr:aminotransferase class V-fold PLP-dependent enzyme [bacterium BFN5]QJW46714.1 aminotransferase class V-fold PLP-dependent enzyme [bacterium BFN5]